MADADADTGRIEANRLAAQARRAARDELVDFDIETKLNEIVRSGSMVKELDDAFNFTQNLLAGMLG